MAEYVRVRDKETGHHYSVTRARLERSPELFAELKQPATHPNGTPLPPKFKTTVRKAAEKQAPQDSGAVESDK